ncbi:MAG: hypothetical protein E6H08_03910 [Bacteroidetes bacterium]|nr:MAG: hypothetical protein E6H08_03910 [Bacteroidota bacterium]
MNAIVENFELCKNNFSKWFSGVFALLSLFAFFITIGTNDSRKWWTVAGVVMFGAIFYFNLRSKISVSHQGIVIRDVFKERDIRWLDITSLDYNSSYHGHGVSLVLTIKYSLPIKTVLLHVKQYKKKEMQRLFEILDQQCIYANKNEHFIKQVKGEMNWKEKLKMY